MSIFDIFSRHPRGDISAHADGELAPDRRDALEAHLAGCERCATELAGLLAVRSALQDLPQVTAPRSFTLTPAMADREPRPVMSRTTPSFVAMRVAGAGFAAVLAVVVMLDAGGIVDDTGSGGSDESTSLGFLDPDPANRDAEMDGSTEYSADALPEGSGGEIPGNLATTAPVDDGASVPATGAGVGGVDGGPDEPEDVQSGSDDEDPALAPLRNDVGQDPTDATNTLDTADDLAEIDGDASKAAAPESGDGAPAAFTSDDGGVSSLLVIEIGLAALAVLAVGGSFVMRRRAESE